MANNFGDDPVHKEPDPHYKIPEYVKSEREERINELSKLANTGDKDAQKALLELIEGEEFYMTQAKGQRKIILFNGPPRCGKDTAAKFAMDHLGKRGEQYRFASPLKDGVHALFGFKSVDTEFFNHTKDQATPVFKGSYTFGEPEETKEINTARDAYIYMSEQCLKPVFGKDFFARVAVRNISNMRHPVVVISDCGFIEEATALIDAFGKENVAIVHMYREGTAFDTGKVKDSRNYISDVDCEKFDIYNDGTVHDLYDKVVAILDGFTNAK